MITLNPRHLAFLPLVVVGALVVYKTQGSIMVLSDVSQSGAVGARPDVVAFGAELSRIGSFERTANYLIVIGPALVFGVLISAAVHAFIPPEWIARAFGAGAASRGARVRAGLAGAPLMLCSCCVAPVFSCLAETSARIGPALSVMLASPALNPAALILTFLLFRPEVAIGRLAMAVVIVLASAPLIERILPQVTIRPRDLEYLRPDEPARGAVVRLARSLAAVSMRTVPVLIAGVITSMLLIEWLPDGLFETPASELTAIIVIATVAVPLALPTFLEIPIALSLLAGGFPAGAALAFLLAGPAVNLPSLLTVGRVAGWKAAGATGGLVWIIAVAGGLLISRLPGL